MDTNTSIREINSLSNQVQIYPNPTANSLNIESSVSIQQVELFDIIGKQQTLELIKASTKSYHLNLSLLPNGIYFLRIKTDYGGVVSKKVVKR